MQRINFKLYRGTIDRKLRVLYNYTFEAEGDFRTVYQKEPTTSVTISPSFGVSISHGYGEDSVYVPSSQYYVFTSLLETVVKLISEHLYELFPNAGKVEFEINAKTLERFQTEQAVSNNGITMIPAVFVDDTNQCYPGIQITTVKLGSIKIPLQDAIPMSKMLSSLDPNLMSISMLRILGKIE